MMLIRKKLIDQASRSLAILRADIEQHQAINDLSLNMSSENFFRDVLRLVRGWEDLENANFFEPCAKSIDLISKSKKTIIQVTSTTSSTKLYNTLDALLDTKYEGYNVEIFYLIDVPHFKPKTKQNVEKVFNVVVDDLIYGRDKFIREIENMEQINLEYLVTNYFSDESMRYTEHQVLELACRDLVKGMKTVRIKRQLLKLQDFNSKLRANKILADENLLMLVKSSIDYTTVITLQMDLSEREKVAELVVDTFYRQNIIQELTNNGQQLAAIEQLDVGKLHEICADIDMDMSPVLYGLYDAIRAQMKFHDFNGLHMPWVIIFTFFELCNIGYIKEV